MPIKDGEQRREYYRQYRAKRRAEQPGERNRQDRERRAEQRKAERESLPEPEQPVLWPHQQALYQVLESPAPPRLLTIRKGARVG